MEKEAEWIGKHVIFTDPLRKKRDALITACHSFDTEGRPMYVNLIVVSDDPAAHDSYGRQIDRQYTSVPLSAEGNEAGRYYQFAG